MDGRSRTGMVSLFTRSAFGRRGVDGMPSNYNIEFRMSHPSYGACDMSMD